MIKRNIEIKVRLNRKEAEVLNKKVRKCGVSRESYIRFLLNKTLPKELPPPDYYSMMKELYRIGNNLNQIAQKANSLGVIDVKRYFEAVKEFEEAVHQITKAVVLPEKFE